jgi:predicted CoA-binding protein
MNGSDQYENPSDDQIRDLLKKYKNVAVVGLSSDESRPSFGVSRYLQKRGFKIIPINPKETEILGEKVYPSLSDIPEKVEIVDIFRRPEFVPPIVDEAIKIGAKVIWLQEGIINHPAAIKASQQGVMVVMDKCILKEHRRLCE